MKLLDIELREFAGLWLNNIRYFKMVFVHRTTIILGRNGCGKSRLMEQLHLFSIQKKDFEENGSKVVTAEINGARYQVTSYMSGAHIKNTLINLDEDKVIHKDVNPSYHNLAMHELTGWSIELQQLFCDESNRLTRMKGPDRKYWFGKLSESDLAYALKFHTKLKEENRDLMGAIKNIKIEIGEMAHKVSDTAGEYDQIRASLENLTSLYNGLEGQCLALTQDPAYIPTITEEVLLGELEKLEQHADEILSIQFTRDTQIEQIDTWTIGHNIGVATAEANNLLQHLMSLQQSIADAEGSAESVDDLLEWIDSTSVEIEDVRQRIYHPQVRDALQVYHTNYAVLHERYGATLGDSGTGSRPECITQEHIQQVKDSIAELNGHIYRCESYIEYADKHLAHFQTADRTECPECAHKFVVGYTQEAMNEMVTKRAAALAAMTEYDSKRDTQRELLVALLFWHGKIAEFTTELERLRMSNPVDYLILSAQSGQMITGTINTLAADWQLKQKLITLTASKAELVGRLALATKYSPEALAEIRLQIELTEMQYKCHMSTVEQLKAQLVIKQHYTATQTRLGELKDLLNIYYQSVEDKEIALVKRFEYEDISNEMTRIGRLAEETRSRFILMDDNRIQLERLRARLSTLIAEQEVSAALVKAMGPEEGLLAKHLYRSITRVTDVMSAYIDKVWGYPLQVYPCDVVNGELNYRFPYRINNKEKLVDDISMSSKGQAKVFDLSFVYTVYQLKQLRGYPLFMDEPLSEFDEEHRDASIKHMNALLERGDFSQLFMISHDPDIHFQLTQADYLVIDANGISVPKHYNQNVEMH